LILEKVIERIKKSAEAKISYNLSSCPLCHASNSIRIYWAGASSGKMRDILSCSNCHARWRFYTDLIDNVCWAKLDKNGIYGKGDSILEKWYRLEFWHKLSIDSSLIDKLKAIQEGNVLLCPSCGYRNPTQFGYCGQCGTLLREDETRIY